MNLPKDLSNRKKLWVHALSVGEVLSAIPLLEQLKVAFPEKEIVFSVTTRSGMALAREKLSGRVACIMTLPVDAWWCMRRVINHVRPAAFILVETDLWPGLLDFLKRKGVGSLLVNGRISPRTLKSYQKAPSVIRRMFAPLKYCLMQTDLDRDRLLQLGMDRKKVITTGNIKFDRQVVPMEESEKKTWLEALGLKPDMRIWVAGSTHGGEEEVVLRVFQDLKPEFPLLCLIIAPRDVGRAPGISRMISSEGAAVTLRSTISEESRPFDVLVLDTVGELGHVYALGSAAFVGGSFVPVGGHNMLEPAAFGIPVLFGPHTHNFEFMSESILKSGGAQRVQDGKELYDAMKRLLSDSGMAGRMGDRAKNFVVENRGALNRVVGYVSRNMAGGESHGFMGEFPRKRDWSSIHREKTVRFYTPALVLFSFLYGAAQRLRYAAYGIGILKKKALPGLVVSVGNLTAGGTGKTPAVAALAKWALSRKYRASIISRGYGGAYKSRVLEVSDGQRVHADSRLAGDEPLLLAGKVPGSPVVLSKKRYLAGMYAHDKFETEIFIIDDGFQHMQLDRDLNLVLMDALEPFGNGHLLPWGPLREPLDQLKRADAFILTRFRPEGGDRTLCFLKEKYPEIPVFCADHVPQKVVFPRLDRADSPESLDGKRVVAFAGIGNPHVFRDTLEALGARVVAFRGFKDHYAYTDYDLDRLVRLKSRTDAQYILTTEKDWMRMGPIWPGCSEIAYLCIQFSFLPEREGVFRMIENAYGKK